MKFLVVSHRGEVPVPDEQLAENQRQWGVWMDNLNEQLGLRHKGGKTISSKGIGEYGGDSAGVSIIEASSLDEALERVKSCPGLPFGWAFDVLYE